MRLAGASLVAGLALAMWACVSELDAAGPSGADAGAGESDAGPTGYDELDVDRARARFVTTTDLMRYVFAPGCAAENNECHSNEDFPDLHTEGNLWNLVDLPCNLGVGERTTVEDFCEAKGDRLRLMSGPDNGFEAGIGAISLITDEAGEFVEYRVTLDRATPQAAGMVDFVLVRDGVARSALGAGSSLATTAGAAEVTISAAGDLADPGQIRQGDENGNGVFGTGAGVLVRRGDARGSYLVRRLLGVETQRVRMPLDQNADNPNELNRHLSADEMYAIMSWINCMEPEDGAYAPIRYDCAANADNRGRW